MQNHSIRIDRDADLILDKFKLEAHQKYNKKIYKRDILAWCIKHCLATPKAQKMFREFLTKK